MSRPGSGPSQAQLLLKLWSRSTSCSLLVMPSSLHTAAFLFINLLQVFALGVACLLACVLQLGSIVLQVVRQAALCLCVAVLYQLLLSDLLYECSSVQSTLRRSKHLCSPIRLAALFAYVPCMHQYVCPLQGRLLSIAFLLLCFAAAPETA